MLTVERVGYSWCVCYGRPATSIRTADARRTPQHCKSRPTSLHAPARLPSVTHHCALTNNGVMRNCAYFSASGFSARTSFSACYGIFHSFTVYSIQYTVCYIVELLPVVVDRCDWSATRRTLWWSDSNIQLAVIAASHSPDGINSEGKWRKTDSVFRKRCAL